MYKILFSFCIVVVIITACSRGGSQAAEDQHVSLDLSDTTVPAIEIHSPADNQVFISGDTIKVDGRVTDNSLFKGSVRITNDANGAVIKEQLYEIHGYQLYDFHVEHKTAVASVVNYTVTVQYEDHGLNAGSKTVKIKVNP